MLRQMRVSSHSPLVLVQNCMQSWCEVMTSIFRCQGNFRYGGPSFRSKREQELAWLTDGGTRRRGLLARVQPPKQFLFEFERGLEARACELTPPVGQIYCPPKR